MSTVNKKCNNLNQKSSCKTSGIIIVLAISMMLWFVYNRLLRKYSGDKFSFNVFKFPHKMKCTFPNVSIMEKKNNCIDADFDGWSILHVIMYLVMGILFPGEYIIVLFVSILSEAWEYVSGWRARWIVDPVVNLASYWVGSQLSYRYKWDLCRKYNISRKQGIIGIIVLSIFAFINNPDFIGLQE